MAEVPPVKKAFVTGFPLKQSRSPVIHGHWLRQYAIDGAYEKVEVAPEDFGTFVKELKRGDSGFCGGNVTMPHKEAAFALADRPDALATALGAANTLWLEDGLLHATNTDVHGFLANLDAGRPGWDKGDNRRAVVLGAGGASRAIVHALRERGFLRIEIVNRTVERAERLASTFGPIAVARPLDALDETLRGADLFVNTSALGMAGEAMLEIDFAALADGALVTDIVYAPLETPFLTAAARHGVAVVDGLGMLLHQAVPGFKRWFGIRPEVTAELRELVVADLETQG